MLRTPHTLGDGEQLLCVDSTPDPQHLSRQVAVRARERLVKYTR